MEMFEREGVRFQHPGDWQLEVETEGESWTASLQSPGTAFLVVSYVPGVVDPDELVEAAVAGLEAEYPNLEKEDSVDTIAGQPALGVDVSFVHLDLTNTCWVRAVDAPGGALLILAQCNDDELDERGEILHAIMGSISADE